MDLEESKSTEIPPIAYVDMTYTTIADSILKRDVLLLGNQAADGRYTNELIERCTYSKRGRRTARSNNKSP